MNKDEDIEKGIKGYEDKISLLEIQVQFYNSRPSSIYGFIEYAL